MLWFMLALGTLLAADDWPGFHGLQKQGVGAGAPAPDAWSPGRNVAWRTEIRGRGHSSPVISGNKVLVTTAYATTRLATVRLVFSYCLAALACVLKGGVDDDGCSVADVHGILLFGGHGNPVLGGYRNPPYGSRQAGKPTPL